MRLPNLMKRALIYIVGLFLSVVIANAQDYEQVFRDLQQQFQERTKTAPANLKSYLEVYPYTPYSDEIHFMEGVLQAEKGK